MTTLGQNLPDSLHASRRGQRLYPVVGADGKLAGVVGRKDLQALARQPGDGFLTELEQIARRFVSRA